MSGISSNHFGRSFLIPSEIHLVKQQAFMPFILKLTPPPIFLPSSQSLPSPLFNLLSEDF